jgi:benzoyl-CoA reductase/2-hydroxyglutaryl-CoA dehydratase subunit BcrC/BadD/HgdB
MISIDIDHFRARILQDALTEATAQYWAHRAYQFQQAAPRLDEYRGNATREELNEACTRCHATSQACLQHADLLRGDHPEPVSDEVSDVLWEVA